MTAPTAAHTGLSLARSTPAGAGNALSPETQQSRDASVPSSPVRSFLTPHGTSAPAAPSLAPGAASSSWKAAARQMAPTHTRRETATALGVNYNTLKGWAREAGVTFRPTGAPPEDKPAPEMDDDERLDLLAQLMAAEARSTWMRCLDRRLRDVTSRPEPARDVAAALARLEAA